MARTTRLVQFGPKFLVEDVGPTIGGKLFHEGPMKTKVYKGDVPSVVVHQKRSGFFFEDVKSADFLNEVVDRPGAEPRARFVEREKIASMAALLLPHTPSEDGDELVGVMFANYRDSHVFNIDERQALEMFADYAAVAILNARNEARRVREKMSLVSSLSMALAHKATGLVTPVRLATMNLDSILPKEWTDQRNLLRQIVEFAEEFAKVGRDLKQRAQSASQEDRIAAVAVGDVLSEALEEALTLDREVEISINLSQD